MLQTYTVLGTAHCRKRKGLFRRGPLRKSNRRSAIIVAPSKKAAMKAYRTLFPVSSGCTLRVYASPVKSKRAR